MKNHYAAVKTIKSTGQKVVLYGRIKFGVWYFTADNWATQAKTKREACLTAGIALTNQTHETA